nr:IS21-like element helper ATPase IstB [Microscilla sp. PRE1]
MNNTQTCEKLRAMRLQAMAELHEQYLASNQNASVTTDEYLALLTDHQWEARQHQKSSRLLKQAHFKQRISLEEINYAQQRNLDKNMFQRLATLDFIAKKENLIITGPSGLGKSFMSQALGHQACMEEYKVLYQNTGRMLKKLKLAKVDGTYLKELRKINHVHLLILDDFGLQAMDNQARETMLDIIDERYQQQSTIITSQIPVSAWYDVIGEGTIADAILDRLVNSSHRIDLKGESMRKLKVL